MQENQSLVHKIQRVELVRPLNSFYNDETTHVIFEPLDFIARLVAPMPRPRVNLTRYHRVFAPHFNAPVLSALE